MPVSGSPKLFAAYHVLHRPLSSAEYIGGRRLTWGTETSQYLEEKKEKSISLVAVSEAETA